jgi:hypothetical protein
MPTCTSCCALLAILIPPEELSERQVPGANTPPFEFWCSNRWNLRACHHGALHREAGLSRVPARQPHPDQRPILEISDRGRAATGSSLVAFLTYAYRSWSASLLCRNKLSRARRREQKDQQLCREDCGLDLNFKFFNLRGSPTMEHLVPPLLARSGKRIL